MFWWPTLRLVRFVKSETGHRLHRVGTQLASSRPLIAYSLVANDKNGTCAIDVNSRPCWVVEYCPRCPPWTLKLPFLKKVDAWWQRSLMDTLSYMNEIIAVTIIITEITSTYKAWAVLGTVMSALYYQLFSLCNNPILWSLCFLFLCHHWFHYCW